MKRDRRKTVSLQQENRHLLWYCIKRDDDSLYYPFAEHDRWMYWAQNTDERHRFNSQKNVYLDKSPDHANLSLEEINKMVRQKNYDSLQQITGWMQMYSSNILGSDGYFAKKRKDLEALMQQGGLLTFWFTFSAADNHWKDLHQLNGSQPEDGTWTEERKAKHRRKFVRENPHIVDSYFMVRIQSLLKSFLGPNCLDHHWFWFRIEYQTWGSPHAHGCCRLRSDPGLCNLGQKVIQGQEAGKMLLAAGLSPNNSFSDVDTRRRMYG